MQISIFGTGYVGLITGICLADLGNKVICVDVDESKIQGLKNGIVPFFEPGLNKLIAKNKKRLSFTTNANEAIEKSQVIFIAVGTPQQKNGSADLKYVFSVVNKIAEQITEYKTVVIKSTVPPNTNKLITKMIAKKYKGQFAVLSNPEFLRQGSALYDFMYPDRIIIGTDNPKTTQVLQKIYKPLKSPIILTDSTSAELIKYASNSFLATKISFVNSIANLAEKVGADVDKIAEGMGLDKRIGPLFLKAGLGYGGSCFPKDVQALLHIASTQNLEFGILKEVSKTNKKQRLIPIQKLEKSIKLKNSRIAILGLTFKPDTDDIREAPSIDIIKALLDKGAKVFAWDPISEKKVEALIPNVKYFPNPYEALEDADAAIIVTEWKEVKQLNLKKVKKLMKRAILIDGRNVLNKNQVIKAGIKYIGIGR
jgi:UDPglucose 6-dehydrogenase